MGMKYTKVPTNAFKQLQMNAGIIVDAFNPATGVIGNILGATSGGIKFNANPTFNNLGTDIDNCPDNAMELERISYYDPTLSGTFLSVTPAVIANMIGAGDVDQQDETHVIPRSVLLTRDFKDLWFIGDYSDANTGDDAGFLAIHIMNALNKSGFQITTGKNAKGQFAIEYHGYYSMEDIDTVPFEIFCKAGSAVTYPSVYLNNHAVNVAVGSTVTLTAATTPAAQTVTWTSGTTAKATVNNGVVTGVSAGSSIITASITVDGVTYTDTCTVVVSAAS